MLSITDCNRNQNGLFYHSVFTQQQCWISLHLLHSIIASIMCAIFAIFSMIIGLVYFEAKLNTRDVNSK